MTLCRLTLVLLSVKGWNISLTFQVSFLQKKEEEEVWRWWDEEPHPDGIKWKTLEHMVSRPVLYDSYESYE